MLGTRVMPCLLLRNASLVKTVQFKNASYVGDPVNAIRIYNEKEIDELILLDIGATPEGREPSFHIIADIASECFMPVAYGGGIATLEHIRTVLRLGIEKVALNTHAIENPDLVRRAAERFGSQSIVVSIDAKKRLWGGYEVCTRGGRRPTGMDPAEVAARMAALGAGEILVTSIDRDGTMKGYDLELLKHVSRAVEVPVIACGGAGSLGHFQQAVKVGGAAAVASGSMVVYYGPHRAVLINFPKPEDLRGLFT